MLGKQKEIFDGKIHFYLQGWMVLLRKYEYMSHRQCQETAKQGEALLNLNVILLLLCCFYFLQLSPLL